MTKSQQIGGHDDETYLEAGEYLLPIGMKWDCTVDGSPDGVCGDDAIDAKSVYTVMKLPIFDVDGESSHRALSPHTMSYLCRSDTVEKVIASGLDDANIVANLFSADVFVALDSAKKYRPSRLSFAVSALEHAGGPEQTVFLMFNGRDKIVNGNYVKDDISDDEVGHFREVQQGHIRREKIVDEDKLSDIFAQKEQTFENKYLSIILQFK